MIKTNLSLPPTLSPFAARPPVRYTWWLRPDNFYSLTLRSFPPYIHTLLCCTPSSAKRKTNTHHKIFLFKLKNKKIVFVNYNLRIRAVHLNATKIYCFSSAANEVFCRSQVRKKKQVVGMSLERAGRAAIYRYSKVHIYVREQRERETPLLKSGYLGVMKSGIRISEILNTTRECWWRNKQEECSAFIQESPLRRPKRSNRRRTGVYLPR